MAFTIGTPISASEYNSIADNKVTLSDSHTFKSSLLSSAIETHETAKFHSRSVVSSRSYNFEIKIAETRVFTTDSFKAHSFSIEKEGVMIFEWFLADVAPTTNDDTLDYSYVADKYFRVHLPAGEDEYQCIMKFDDVLGNYYAPVTMEMKCWQGKNNVVSGETIKVYNSAYSDYIVSPVTRALASAARLGSEPLVP